MKNPSEHFSLPVIGTLSTKSLSFTSFVNNKEEVTTVPSTTYEIIKFEVINNQTVYVCNFWYDYAKLKPLWVIESIVENFNPLVKD